MTLPSQRGRTATAVSRLMKRFSREERGVVAIEFALIAPLLVALLLGTTSLTNSIWANGKVDHTANVIGDLVAQSPVLTDATTGNDSLRTLMAAAPGLMVPFASTGMEVTVTEAIACHVDPTADDSEIKFFVVWSRSWSDGSMYERSGYAHASDLPESPGNLRIGNGDYLVVTELAYEHHPPITISSTTGISMKEVAFHQPRDNSSIHFEPAGTQNNVGCSTLL